MLFFILFITLTYSQTCTGDQIATIIFNNGVPSIQCRTYSTDNCTTGKIVDGKCTECIENYRLTNSGCVKCPDGCTSCNMTHCFSCSSNLQLATDQTKCVDCSKTENNEYCGNCPTGKYFDISMRSCQSCRDNCALCTTSTNCFKCKNNKYLKIVDENKAECLEIENCLDIKTDHCEQCKEGYRLDLGACKKCSDSKCLSCYKSGEVEKCSKCVAGSVLSNGDCVTKESLNCEEGSPIYGCTKCIDGYFFNSDLKCEKCDEKCGSCIREKENCLSCSQDHYFNKSTHNCTKKDANCKLVDQAGCKECINDLGDEEKNGYFIKPNEQKCEQCSGKCKLCDTSADNCTVCLKNSLLQEDTTTPGKFKCVELSQSNFKGICLKTSMGYCTECAEGYYIHSDGKTQVCKKCDESCSSCQNSETCTNCASEYYWPKGTERKLCKSKGEINMTCTVGPTGCEQCKADYWINPNDPTMYNCSSCLEKSGGNCTKCHFNIETGNVDCDACTDKNFYSKNGKCEKCTELPNCLYCKEDKCITCQNGYTLDPGAVSCSKTNWGLIIPIIVVVVVIFIIIVVFVIVFIWWKRKEKIKDEAAAIKPFHVSSEIEMFLLEADNEHFPLKTNKWELNFDLAKTKAVVDEEYEEVVQLANTSKREYYFEFYVTPSHKYDIQIIPKSATLKPGTAINVTFKLKMLCTTTVSDHIGISAMDVDDQNKEIAKFTVVVESDLSMKLDHQELKPIMPPIGEGAFGMVFRGSDRGREVAIKKMKARNMTPEQEKEFNHEVSMMTQLRHSTVVELIGAVYTEGEISIVTEFAEYGSLSKIWKKHKLTFALKVKILDDMAVALAYLHKNNILHRDVKGENLLVYNLNQHSPVCAKLTDFGTCRNISEHNLSVKELTTGIGTPTYMSPESLQNSSDYSYPVDVYAFAIVLYETYIEKNGYENDERFNQPWLIPQFVIEGNRLDKPEGIPENYWELITKCWQHNPEDRPTFISILETIENWGEDIRYALHVDGNKLVGADGASDVSSTSSASVPSSAQEQSESESNRDGSTTGDASSRTASTKPADAQKKEKSSSSTTSSSSDD